MARWLNRTSIEWVKNPDGTQGYTWNPVTGCLNNCEYCYARRLAWTRLKMVYAMNTNQAPDGFGNEKLGNLGPFWPRFWPDRLNDIPVGGKSKGIFVCDMGELFGPWLPFTWPYRVMDVIRDHPQHRFYLLTKQPQELHKWSPFPENCWVGVSATTNGDMTRALMGLSNVQATVRYLSCEPLLGQLGMDDHMSLKGIVDWVIIGAQTKPTVMPRRGWVEEIEAACDRAGIPVFEKNSLAPLFPERKLRQEVP